MAVGFVDADELSAGGEFVFGFHFRFQISLFTNNYATNLVACLTGLEMEEIEQETAESTELLVAAFVFVSMFMSSQTITRRGLSLA